jgi:hypothetical protein
LTLNAGRPFEVCVSSRRAGCVVVRHHHPCVRRGGDRFGK